jgi:hypothetical protein
VDSHPSNYFDLYFIHNRPRKILCQDSRALGRDLNLELSKYKADVLGLNCDICWSVFLSDIDLLRLNWLERRLKLNDMITEERHSKLLIPGLLPNRNGQLLQLHRNQSESVCA